MRQTLAVYGSHREQTATKTIEFYFFRFSSSSSCRLLLSTRFFYLFFFWLMKQSIGSLCNDDVCHGQRDSDGEKKKKGRKLSDKVAQRSPESGGISRAALTRKREKKNSWLVLIFVV